jgi:AraC-like DNA-binding protein
VNVQAQVLNAVFGAVRIGTAQLGRLELFAPWGGQVSARSDLLLHHVLEGSAWLRANNGETRHLRTGDVVLIPRHVGHALCDSLDTPIRSSNFWEGADTPTFGVSAIRRRLGGDGARTVVLCAALELTGAGKRLLLEALPDSIHVRGEEQDAIAGLTAVLELIRDEVRNARAAAELILTRYAEILVLGVLRAAPPSAQPSWLSAATHVGVAQALTSIHARPRDPWSVATLAKEAGMSRSAFAETFTRSVGEGPIRYLTRWRLALAKELLTSTTSESVEAIAEQVGYANAAAFSTAFRREFGAAPGSLRRR